MRKRDWVNRTQSQAIQISVMVSNLSTIDFEMIQRLAVSFTT